MEAKRSALDAHLANISSALKEVCDVADTGPPLVRENDLLITSATGPGPLFRSVTTDLGGSEFALRLPIPDVRQPRYWIGVHERWQAKGKHKIRFYDWGIRIYFGRMDEDLIQLMRLEWVAPTVNPDGDPVYAGEHAGHPHWHIDQSALVGSEDYRRSLDALTTPKEVGVEDFDQTTVQSPQRLVHDCSWLRRIHLPAQAEWMHKRWDANKIPGPHQSEPASIGELGHWWNGALRYVAAELQRAAPYLTA